MDFKKAINSAPTVLVEFYASWCPHCQRMMPVVDEVKRQLGAEGAVVQYDIDRYSELAESQGVETIPTFIVYRNGQPSWRGVGEMTAEALESHLRETQPA